MTVPQPLERRVNLRILALLVVAALSGCYEDKMRQQFKDAGCAPAGAEELKDQPKKACGKACMRYVQREYFSCSGMIRHFDY